jgi:hypothetical protein
VHGRDTARHGVGHVDVLIGRAAPAHVWPRLGAWLEARAAARRG